MRYRMGFAPECGSGFAQDRKGRGFRRHLEKLPKRDKNGNVLCDENGKVVMCGGTLSSGIRVTVIEGPDPIVRVRYSRIRLAGKENRK